MTSFASARGRGRGVDFGVFLPGQRMRGWSCRGLGDILCSKIEWKLATMSNQVK